MKFLYSWYFGVIKALLPCGIIPRKSVKGDVVLITGSGGTLGRLLAKRFADLGAVLVLWDVDEKLNTETKQIIDCSGGKSYAYTVDLSNRDQIYECARRVKEDVGNVDILINNAGIVSGKNLFDCPDDMLERIMAVNSHSLFFTAKAFVPEMIERRKGHVTTISSLAGLQGVNGLAAYCSSKYAAIGFNESLRAEFLSNGYDDIHVTTVCPYYMTTKMFRGVQTYCPMIFPILDPELVADRTTEAILTNATDLYIPRTAYLLLALKAILPTRASAGVLDYFGLNKTMETFTG